MSRFLRLHELLLRMTCNVLPPAGRRLGTCPLVVIVLQVAVLKDLARRRPSASQSALGSHATVSAAGRATSEIVQRPRRAQEQRRHSSVPNSNTRPPSNSSVSTEEKVSNSTRSADGT